MGERDNSIKIEVKLDLRKFVDKQSIIKLIETVVTNESACHTSFDVISVREALTKPKL